MRLNSLKCYFFSLCLTVLAGIVSAQSNETSEPERPKIGLVLSGGGAKGIAHVGVIKAMEEAGLKADYVVGTSMGSVVGGLYALGYSAAEMEDIIRSIDWDLLLSNRVSFEDISFEEKEYYNRYVLELPVINRKIAFPSGLIEGQTLSNVLHYYTWPSLAYSNFDEFPIPFRCVATDISTGEPIIFDRGYLQDALRSSIAIPTVFSPFQLDSTSVVDGGVVNNFPVDVAREMGADIVIGVNVSDEGFASADKLESFAAILMQLAMSESLRQTRDHIEDTDIYIKPDLGPYSTGSFSDYNEILKLGEEAGQEFLFDFQALGEQIGMNEPVKNLDFESIPITINKITVKGNDLISDPLILSKFSIKEGQRVTRDDLSYGVDMIFGINAFYRVDYALIPTDDGKFNLEIKVIEKPAVVLSTAFHYDTQFSAGLLLNLTARNWLGNLSRTVFLLDVSENPKFRFDYYKYTGESKRFAFNGRINYLSSELPRYEEGRVTEVFGERNLRLEANMISTSSLKQSFHFGVLMENSRSRAKINVTVPANIRSANQAYFGLRFLYYRNSQNDRNFPTRGAESRIESVFHLSEWTNVNLRSGVDTVFLDFEGTPIGIPSENFESFVKELAPDPHMRLYGRYSKFLHLSDGVQFQPTIAAGFTMGLDQEFRSYTDFFVGGVQNLLINDTRAWGLNYGEVTTPNFVKAGASFQFIPLKKIYLRAGANFISYSDYVSLNDSDFLGRIFQDESLVGYGIDLSYQSILGPITIGVSDNSLDSRVRGYFSLGFSFGYSDR